MQKAVVSVIRNEYNQILILERHPIDKTYSGICLPGGKVEASESLIKALEREILEETGLTVAGLHMIGDDGVVSVSPTGGTFMVYGFSSYVTGGRLLKFPTREHLSASWVSPTVALCIQGLGSATRHYLEKSKWIS